jgi:hypothetical protein
LGLLIVGAIQSIRITDGAGQTHSLSHDVEATRRAVLVLFFLIVAFVISANFFATHDRVRFLTNFLVIYGLALALFALVQHLAWNGKFYWFRPNTQGASPFGPFVSHNHFAGYMELLIPIPIAQLLARGVPIEARLFYAFAAVMMGVAEIASLSRGGMISLAATLLFIALVNWAMRNRAARLRRARRSLDPSRTDSETRTSTLSPLAIGARSVAMVAAIVIVIVAGIVWIGPDRVVERVAQGASSDGRQQKETFFLSRGWIWRDSLTLIEANPLTGVGLGAFQTAYPIYGKSDGSLTVGQTHNDYLQILADCGIIGGALAVWFIWSILGAIFRGVRVRDPLLAGFALGGGAGLFALLVHSALDFNLQLPSNALLFLVIAAVVSQVGVVGGQPRPGVR